MPRVTSKDRVRVDKESWRARTIHQDRTLDIEYSIESEKHPTEDDVVLKNQRSGANIRIGDDGTIRLFSDDNTGIIIDPNSGTIQHYCKKYKAETKEYHIQSDDDRFMWNYMPFNPALKDPFKEIVTTNCVPMPLPFQAETAISGTSIMKEILTNPGTYIGAVPTNPGTANFIDTPAVGLEGIRAYKGIQELNILQKGVEGIKEIIS